jgi:hypothetical protein
LHDITLCDIASKPSLPSSTIAAPKISPLLKKVSSSNAQKSQFFQLDVQFKSFPKANDGVQSLAPVERSLFQF